VPVAVVAMSALMMMVIPHGLHQASFGFEHCAGN
jgi:hypothetical protein